MKQDIPVRANLSGMCRLSPFYGIFLLIGVFPQKNNIKIGKLHDKWEIIL